VTAGEWVAQISARIMRLAAEVLATLCIVLGWLSAILGGLYVVLLFMLGTVIPFPGQDDGKAPVVFGWILLVAVLFGLGFWLREWAHRVALNVDKGDPGKRVATDDPDIAAP